MGAYQSDVMRHDASDLTRDRTDYGPKFEYNPQWRGPMSVERKVLHFGYLFFYFGVLMVWLIMGTFAVLLFSSYYGLNDNHILNRKPEDYAAVPFAPISVASIILSGLISVFYINMIQCSPNVLVCNICILVFLVMFLFTASALLLSLAVLDTTSAAVILLPMIFIGICGGCICLFYGMTSDQNKMTRTALLMKEANRGAAAFPSLYLINYICALFLLALTYFSCVFIHCYLKIMDVYNPVLAFLGFTMAFLVYPLAWLILLGFVISINRMIGVTAFCIWYWTQDKRKVPWSTVPYSITVTLRYYLGFAARAVYARLDSPFITYHHRDHYYGHYSDHYHIYQYDGFIYGIYVPVKYEAIKFLNDIATCSSTMCVLHGTDFRQSARSYIRLGMRNRQLYHTVHYGETCLVCSCITITTLFSSIIIIGVAFVMIPNSRDLFILISVPVICGVTAATFYSFNMTLCALVMCVLEDFERNNGTAARPYFMNDKIKELFTNPT